MLTKTDRKRDDERWFVPIGVLVVVIVPMILMVPIWLIAWAVTR